MAAGNGMNGTSAQKTVLEAKPNVAGAPQARLLHLPKSKSKCFLFVSLIHLAVYLLPPPYNTKLSITVSLLAINNQQPIVLLPLSIQRIHHASCSYLSRRSELHGPLPLLRHGYGICVWKARFQCRQSKDRPFFC
jgi:hypothetical protein